MNNSLNDQLESGIVKLITAIQDLNKEVQALNGKREAQKILELETQIKELKAKKKDVWDIFQIIAGFLIPISIALVGYYYSNQMKAAEIETSKSQANNQLNITKEQTETQKVVAEINSRVTK